jgi:hypothetical protein
LAAVTPFFVDFVAMILAFWRKDSMSPKANCGGAASAAVSCPRHGRNPAIVNTNAKANERRVAAMTLLLC